MFTAGVVALVVQLGLGAGAPARTGMGQGTPREAHGSARSSLAAGEWASWLACQDPAQTDHVLWKVYRKAYNVLGEAPEPEAARSELSGILRKHRGDPGKSRSWTTSLPKILATYAHIRDPALLVKEMLDLVEQRVGRAALLTDMHDSDAVLVNVRVSGARATAEIAATGEEVRFIRRHRRWFLAP